MLIICPGCHYSITYLLYKKIEERIYTVKLSKKNILKQPANNLFNSLKTKDFYLCPLCSLIIADNYKKAEQFLKGAGEQGSK